MEEQIALQELGLTENEAKVYLFLLENGSSTIAEVTKKIAVHRVNVYDILKRLLEKGLVSYAIEGRKKYFNATDPDIFLKSLKEKEELFNKILPNLELKKKLAKVKYEVKVFQGKKGIKAILEDMLKQKKTIYVFGAQGNFAETLPIYYQQFNKRRTKEKIKIKIIHSENVREWRGKNPIAFADVKFISKLYDSPSTTFIYGNKIAIIMWMEPPLGILIESKELSKSYFNFWEILWKIAKK